MPIVIKMTKHLPRFLIFGTAGMHGVHYLNSIKAINMRQHI